MNTSTLTNTIAAAATAVTLSSAAAISHPPSAISQSIATPAAAAWTYSGPNYSPVISNGNWTLGVSVSGTNLTVVSYTAGSGELDLRGDVISANGAVTRV